MKLRRFQKGKPLVPQLNAAHLNAVIDLAEANQPLPGKGTKLRRYRNGFSYSADSGSRGQTIKLGFTVRRKTSETVTVSPAVVSGCSVVAAMPKIGSTRLDATTAPELDVTPDLIQYVCLRIEVVPEDALNADGVTYSIRDGAGLISGDITVAAYDEETMSSVSQPAIVNAETGDVEQNGIFLVPLARISETGTIANTGYYYGPLGIKLCSSGTLQVQGPVIAVATLE